MQVKHGSKATYNNHRCRCGVCKKANTDYMRIRRRFIENPNWSIGNREEVIMRFKTMNEEL